MSRYRTIVADPPWRYEVGGRRNSAGTPTSVDALYPTMSDDEIVAMPIEGMAADNAHLYLWVTNARILDCRPLDILDAWGFTYKTLLTWIKTAQPGLGSYFRGCTEHVIFAVRGSLPVPPAIRERNHFTTPRTAHSSKPDAFYDLVERVSPGPYAELFSRRARFGWEYPIGDQALGGVAA